MKFEVEHKIDSIKVVYNREWKKVRLFLWEMIC